MKTAKKYIENVYSFNETPVSTSGRHQPQQESCCRSPNRLAPCLQL